MHSKVIIASLACVMAASFANGRVSNASVAKAPQLKTQETSCCNAPNEDGISAGLYSDKPYQNCDFCVFLGGVEYQSPLADGLEVMANPSGLDTYIGYNPAYGHYFNVAQPSVDGDFYATIGSQDKEISTLYIYRKNGICYGSVLSKYDARAKYYMNEVATSSELSYYPQSWTGSETLNSTTAINAVKHYGTYVYSGTSDISATYSKTQRSGWNDYGSNLSIKVQVEMYKNGTVYPVESARIRLFSSGTELAASTTKRTGTTGMYTYSMNLMDTFNKTLGDLQIGVFTDCGQGKIKDNYGFDYPFFYASTSSEQLFNLKTITYKVRVYPERSDRAAAYELSQAAFVPYRYAINYSHSVSGAKILYPAEKTSYFTSVNGYFGVTTTQLIAIKRAHYNAWDVVGHEYGHFICDKLNLSMDPSNDLYWTHGYKEDLFMTHGDLENSCRMAYSEGLATYFSVAAQLDRVSRYPNSYCAAIADEKYVDPINGVNADFNQYRFGVQNGSYGQAVESTIASVLIKLLDDVNRTGDNVALGHSAMWTAIISAGSSTCDIHSFISTLVSQNLGAVEGIYGILDRECILHPALPDPIEEGRWTIMLYMCGSTLESGGLTNSTCNVSNIISDILSAHNQPNDVNVIIETGGSTQWYGGYNIPNDAIGRYHVENGQLAQNIFRGDGFFPNANMGSQATFESFLNWGLQKYPAEKTGVILVNHGGALNGVCFDSNYGDDSLTNSEIRNALQSSFEANDIDKLEFIGYDACLMQVQDIAEFVAPFFNYMVASQECENECLWSYDEWLTLLYAPSVTQYLINYGDETDRDLYYRFGGTPVILKRIADCFVTNRAAWEQSLSVLNLSAMNDYYVQFEDLAERMYSTVYNNYEHFKDIVLQTYWPGFVPGYGYTENYHRYGVIDGYRFLWNLKNDEVFSSFTWRIDNVLNKLDQVVIYRATTDYIYNQGGCEGLCRGLSFHVLLDDYSGMTYPISETHFYHWRGLFMHEYNAIEYVDSSCHRYVCADGVTYSEAHHFVNVILSQDQDYANAYCDVCNTWVELPVF